MALFTNEPTRVEKIDEPLLVIGLGGTGTESLLRVKDHFRRKFILPELPDKSLDEKPEKTLYLAIDSDRDSLDKRHGRTRLKGTEFFDLSSDGVGNLLDPRLRDQVLNPWEKEWLDKDLTSFDVHRGAGGIRQVGRLLLFRKAQELEGKLRSLITSLVTQPPRDASKERRLTVALIFGVAGGTGSGIFLDVAYMIREIFKRHHQQHTLNIKAFLYTPDISVTDGAGHDDIIAAGMKANGFAALKEMDYWMGYGHHKHPFTQRYSNNFTATWDARPFESCVLLSGTNSNGVPVKNGKQIAMETMAENLLHYFANENSYATVERLGDSTVIDDRAVTGSSNDFSYRSHESNVFRHVDNTPKAYPVQYAYTAVGAFSTSPQQDEMVNYEGELVFEKIVALAERQPTAKEALAETFRKKALPVEGKYIATMDFSPIPDLGLLDAQEFRGGYPNTRLDGKRLEDWKRATVIPGMLRYFYGEEGSEDNTGVYRGYCQAIGAEICEIIEDTARGPYYLEALLSGNDGVLRDVSKVRQQAAAQVKTLEENLDNAKVSVEKLGKQVTRVSLGQKVAEMLPDSLSAVFSNYERYKLAAAEMYELQRQLVYHEKLVEMLGTVYDWLENYINNSLHVFNLASNEIYEACRNETTVNAQRKNDNALVSFSRVKESIKQRFNELQEGADDSVRVESILKKIADDSLAYADITLNQGQTGLRDHFQLYVEGFINDVFKSTNEVNLDNLLGITYATHADRVARVEDYWGNEMWTAATPMFAASANVVVSPVLYSYVSIPENSASFMEGIEEYTSKNSINATLKRSVITERVFWLNTFDGLPLCYYYLLEDQESAYERALNNPALRRGLHLVMPPEGEHGFSWIEMPSPRPHPLLAQGELSPRQAAAQKDAYQLIDRALAAGSVVFSADSPSFRYYQLKNEGGNLMNTDDYKRLCEALPKKTEERPSGQWWKTRLDAIKAAFMNEQTRSHKEIACVGEAERFATMLNMQPHQYTHQVNETDDERRAVDANRAKLNFALQQYVLSGMPATLHEIERQFPLFESLRALVRECEEGLKDETANQEYRQKVLERAEYVAMLQLYGILRTKVGKYTYVHDGEERDFFTLNSTMPSDLRRLATDYLLADYFARQDGQDNVDIELVQEQYLRAFSRRDDMDADEIGALFAKGEKLKDDRWDKAVKKIRGERQAFDRDDRDHYAGFYTKMITAIETELEAFEMIR